MDKKDFTSLESLTSSQWFTFQKYKIFVHNFLALDIIKVNKSLSYHKHGIDDILKQTLK
jgi:hypothetical protein